MLLIPERWQLLLDSVVELCAAWVHGCPSLLASRPPSPCPPPHLRHPHIQVTNYLVLSLNLILSKLM